MLGPTPWLAHFELQASRDARLGSRLFRYNALLDDRHDLPTRSVVVLLRPEADSVELVGEYRRSLPGGAEYLVFRYDVLRVWQEPVATFLDGGLGTLPLAPVANLAGRPIEDVVQAIDRRLDLAPPDLAGLLWSSTAFLMGLIYPAETFQFLLRGVRQMKESTMYQAVLAEGEARGLIQGEILQTRRLLVRQGERRFGPALAADRAMIEGITRIDRLESLVDLCINSPVATWAEFWILAGPGDPA